MSQKNCLSIFIVTMIQFIIFFNSSVAAASDHLTPSPAGNIQMEMVSTSPESNTFTDSDSTHYKKQLGRQEFDSYSSQLDELQYSELSNEELDTIRGGSAESIISMNKNISLTRSVINTHNAAQVGNKNATIVEGVATAGKVLSVVGEFDGKYAKAAGHAGKVIGLATDSYKIATAVQNPSITNIASATSSAASTAATFTGLVVGSGITTAVASTAANVIGLGVSLATSTAAAMVATAQAAPAAAIVVNPSTQRAHSTLNGVGDAQASTLKGLTRQSQPRFIQTYTSPTSSAPQVVLVPSNGAQLYPGFLCAGDCIPVPVVSAFATEKKISTPTVVPALATVKKISTPTVVPALASVKKYPHPQ